MSKEAIFNRFLDPKTEKYLTLPVFDAQDLIQTYVQQEHNDTYSIMNLQQLTELSFYAHYSSFAPDIFNFNDQNVSVLLLHKEKKIVEPISMNYSGTSMAQKTIIIAQEHAQATVIIDQKSSNIFLHQLEIIADQNAEITVFIVSDSSEWSKYSINVHLKGQGAAVHIKGLLALRNTMQNSIQTKQFHYARHTNSTVCVKAIIADNARFLYQGCISIDPEAQYSSATQQNKNILWNHGAQAWSIPSLEVKTNEVTCAHGSATGPLDAEHIWYLQTRGLPLNAIHRLLVNAFFQELFDQNATQALYQRTIMNRILNTILESNHEYKKNT